MDRYCKWDTIYIQGQVICRLVCFQRRDWWIISVTLYWLPCRRQSKIVQISRSPQSSRHSPLVLFRRSPTAHPFEYHIKTGRWSMSKVRSLLLALPHTITRARSEHTRRYEYNIFPNQKLKRQSASLLLLKSSAWSSPRTGCVASQELTVETYTGAVTAHHRILHHIQTLPLFAWPRNTNLILVFMIQRD